MEKHTLRVCTSFWQKIALVCFSLCLTVMLIEVGLRLAGFFILSWQEHKNKLSLKQNGVFRILCLGESTTQDQYPRFLEEILNQRNVGIRFSVIDKGLAGTTTFCIMDRLESCLNTYRPNMVVAMMGINDSGLYMPHEHPLSSPKVTLFMRSLKTYKLARLLWLHLTTKVNLPQRSLSRHGRGEETVSRGVEKKPLFSVDGSFKRCIECNPTNPICYAQLGAVYKAQGHLSETEEFLTTCIKHTPRTPAYYVALGWVYEMQAKHVEAEATFTRCIQINPGESRCYAGLGGTYGKQRRFFEAEKMLKTAVELDPENSVYYIKLGWAYRKQDKFSQAEEVLKKGIALNPHDPLGYSELGAVYGKQGALSQAEEVLKKGIALNSGDPGCYIELGEVYAAQCKFSQAEEAFIRSLALDPHDTGCYMRLGWLYKAQGKYSQTEVLLKKGVEINPSDEALYGMLAVFYEERGNTTLAGSYYRKANKLRERTRNPETLRNYHKLKEILDAHKIKLVCAQYPMRSIASLKKIFEGSFQGIFFVDNERIFKEAVQKEGYKAYFYDIFGGDFGHCTEKGNRLLAENIANTILKEVFGK